MSRSMPPRMYAVFIAPRGFESRSVSINCIAVL
jgi:hypothetical protein